MVVFCMGRIYPSHTKNLQSFFTRSCIVGDGFIRPEITSLCVNGRYLPRNDERAYLGTDKSVPYKKPAIPLT
ncbi:MAG: hypothetical protein FWG87_00875 [Defluviitaleaceae bacterium]|nr:hypothetical protein [Defluviitaleaceae bacterium]